MNWKSIAAAAALMAGAGWAHSAYAVTSITDDFTTNAGDTATLNWAGDGIFDVVPASPSSGSPSVDLVSHATYPDLSFGPLNAVDLDGSEGSGVSPAGEIITAASLDPGNYYVQFWLAGNLRGAAVQTTQFNIGGTGPGGFTVDFSPPADQGFTKVGFYLPVGQSGQVSFTDLGPSDQMGDLVADFSVSAAPEPATWAMLLFGVGGIGAAMRMSKRRERGALATA